MNAAEIIEELPRLTEAERRAVRQRLSELAAQDDKVRVCDAAANEQAAAWDRLEEQTLSYRPVDLGSRGIGVAQAADLRARLQCFAEDWNRPEASIYDADPPR